MNSTQKEVPAQASELPGLQEVPCAWWASAGFAEDARFASELALEELFINAITHRVASHVIVALERTPGQPGARVTISDDSPPCDPLSLPTPDVGAPLEKRSMGGLGLHLIRTMMDEVPYGRDGDLNRLMIARALPWS